MSRLTKRILLTALLGLFLTAPGVVRSQGFDAKTLMRAQQRGQTGSLYGNNPFEQPAEEGEEGEQQPQDTTKKERKIRKPLESYFFSDSVRSPNYWQENLFSNHYIWSTPLGKEDETRFEVKFSIPDFAFEAGAWQGVVSDKIYYDAYSQITQQGGNVSLTSVYARKDFRLGGLHLDNRVLLQWSTNQEVAPVPLLSAFLSYYYEFWVVRDVLRLQIGLDGRYNTRYYAPGYNPALSAFYNQREVEVGNYPYVDAFVMGKWKRMRIFLKYQHVNKGLFGNGEYFSAANYPLNPGMFKIGISWGFYD